MTSGFDLYHWTAEEDISTPWKNWIVSKTKWDKRISLFLVNISINSTLFVYLNLSIFLDNIYGRPAIKHGYGRRGEHVKTGRQACHGTCMWGWRLGMVWHGMAWNAMTWHGMPHHRIGWHDMAWSGMA